MPSPPFPVVVHPFLSLATPHACAYELLPPTPPGSPPPRNALVFIGGLGDGPHTVPYIRTIAAAIAAADPPLDYSVFEIRMSSSFDGFGFGSLARDARDIDGLVQYLRSVGRKKVVLLGHSTGCQDCMEYEKHRGSPVDGFILQGPVSDREGIVPLMDADELRESVAYAEKLIAEDKSDSIMPRELLPTIYPTPLTAYRWHSLASVGGDDDYFSSDLPDDTVSEIWGRLRAPVLVVPSEKDEHVPEHVDFGKLLARWQGFCRPGVFSELSGLIPGASHRVKWAEGQDWLAERVVRFLRG